MEKIECVDHVEKRVGSGPRNVRARCGKTAGRWRGENQHLVGEAG